MASYAYERDSSTRRRESRRRRSSRSSTARANLGGGGDGAVAAAVGGFEGDGTAAGGRLDATVEARRSRKYPRSRPAASAKVRTMTSNARGSIRALTSGKLVPSRHAFTACSTRRFRSGEWTTKTRRGANPSGKARTYQLALRSSERTSKYCRYRR